MCDCSFGSHLNYSVNLTVFQKLQQPEEARQRVRFGLGGAEETEGAARSWGKQVPSGPPASP